MITWAMSAKWNKQLAFRESSRRCLICSFEEIAKVGTKCTVLVALLKMVYKYLLSVGSHHDNYDSITITMCHAKLVVMVLTHSAPPFRSCTMCLNHDCFFGITHPICNTIVQMQTIVIWDTLHPIGDTTFSFQCF